MKSDRFSTKDTFGGINNVWGEFDSKGGQPLAVPGEWGGTSGRVACLRIRPGSCCKWHAGDDRLHVGWRAQYRRACRPHAADLGSGQLDRRDQPWERELDGHHE